MIFSDKRFLITGAGGFVGGHLLNLFDSLKESVTVLGIDRFAAPRIEVVDLMDQDLLDRVVADFRPDFVIHLAAGSSVAESWQAPAAYFLNNTSVFLNLLDAVRTSVPRCRILSVGSAEVYGGTAAAILPFREETPLEPQNPYAVGRLAQEQLAKVYRDGFGLDIVSTRSFNHTGLGQSLRFAVPSFVRQLVDAKRRGEKRAVLRTGNVDVVRDLSDVRDVTAAYLLLLEKGRSGEVYNVCSGKGRTLRSVIETAAQLLELDVDIVLDEGLLRPNDVPAFIGSNDKLVRETAWQPTIAFETTLRDMTACYTANGDNLAVFSSPPPLGEG